MSVAIDSESYPLDHPGSAAYSSLVEQTCAEFMTAGCAVLKGFVGPSVAEAMAAELDGLETFSRRSSQSAWGDPPGDHLDANHIHRRLWSQDINVLAADQLEATQLRALYESDALASFLADVLRLPQLFRFADRFQALNVVEIADGGEHAWHYDLSDFVITLLLQRPDEGGEFEFAPFIRGEVLPGVVGGRDGRVWDERYDDVTELFAGRWSDTRVLDLAPGDLVLFNGLRSMHRVRKVRGPKNRMVAVFSFDTKPGFTSTDAINARLYGPRCERLLTESRRG